MDTKRSPRGDAALGIGHLLVGLATVVLGLVLVSTSRSPGAELETVLFTPGLVVVFVGLVFAYAAWRSARARRPSALGVALGVVEIVTGAAMFAAMAVAVSGYGAFAPWRSPLLVPSLVLLALGVVATLHTLEARRA